MGGPLRYSPYAATSPAPFYPFDIWGFYVRVYTKGSLAKKSLERWSLKVPMIQELDNSVPVICVASNT
jgi:hypothetical protein